MLSPKIVFLLNCNCFDRNHLTSSAPAIGATVCKGALPVFNERTVIIFNRNLLVLLPKAWLKRDA